MTVRVIVMVAAMVLAVVTGAAPASAAAAPLVSGASGAGAEVLFQGIQICWAAE